MKDPALWEEEDIENLIQIGAREGQTLEFKACDSLGKTDGKKQEIARDVSAFANSIGGTIVYGLIESRDTHEAERIDNGYDPADLSELWLEQVIDSNIQRRIEGLTIKPVALRKTSPVRVLYVVCIPESNQAPHMADHRYYKRQNFQRVEMEEYEVRRLYEREAYPGKDIVESWRDDAINPFIDALESEESSLRQERWTWRYFYKEFAGLKKLGEDFCANAEDFVGRHPEVGNLLKDHDSAITHLNNAGKVLFEKTAGGSTIREVFAAATSDESLEKLTAENPNALNGTTGPEIFREIFGTSEIEQQRLNHFTEWAINGKPETNAEPMILFWRAYGERFYALAIYSDYRRSVVQARDKLTEVIETLLTALKRIRRELSERHKIRVRGTYQAPDYTDNTLGWNRKPY